MSSVLFKCHFLTNKKQKTYMTNKKHRFFLSFLLFFLGIMYICKIYVYTKILAKSILSNLCTKIISLTYVHEQVQGLLQVPGPLASAPHHPIDHACKFDPHAFCPQPHHPLRSIYNVTTSRNIYIPPPHTIQSVASTMFASSMNFNIPPNTIHCVASTMIMFASSRIASSIDCEED